MEKEHEVMPMSLDQIKEIEQRIADMVRAYEILNAQKKAGTSTID
tara:strand:+ start:63 stop:197 length:135 start_codon:yes stop_codon:yes gene_type:complete